MKKILNILIIIGVLLFGVIVVLKNCEKESITKNTLYDDNITKDETVIHKELRSETNWSLSQVFDDLLYDDKNFYVYEDYLSDNFKSKYKTRYDIIPEIDELEFLGSYGSSIYGNEGLTEFSFLWKDKNKNSNCTRYYLKIDYTLDRQIDDFKLVKILDYNPNTWERIDGIKEMFVEDLKEYLKYYTTEPDNFYTDTNVTADFDITLGNSVSRDKEYRKYKNIPLTSDFQVINRPEPTRDFAFSVKGFKIMMKYEDDTKYYRIDFDINDQGQFKMIEYVEISREEYLKQ